LVFTAPTFWTIAAPPTIEIAAADGATPSRRLLKSVW
jgi:hypothetical protein